MLTPREPRSSIRRASAAVRLFGVCAIILVLLPVCMYFVAPHGRDSMIAWRVAVGAGFFILVGAFTVAR